MNSKYLTSIIIPTYKRLDMLKKCINGVINMEAELFEVLIVYRPNDDEETTQWLGSRQFQKYKNIKIIPVYESGQVAALNMGLNNIHINTEYIVFFDDDAVPSPTWLSKIIKHFNDPLVGAVGGRDLISGFDKNLVTKAGIIDYWGNLIGRHHLVTGAARKVDLLKGCNMAIRKESLGMLCLDSRLLGKGAQFGNDAWLCLTLKEYGWDIILDPSATVNHYPAKRNDFSRDSYSKKKCYEHTYNTVAILTAYKSGNEKLRFLIYGLFIGTRNCPGFYFILHSLLKRPKSLFGQITGGWSGFIDGWKVATEFKCNPPGTPNNPKL